MEPQLLLRGFGWRCRLRSRPTIFAQSFLPAKLPFVALYDSCCVLAGLFEYTAFLGTAAQLTFLSGVTRAFLCAGANFEQETPTAAVKATWLTPQLSRRFPTSTTPTSETFTMAR